MSRPNIFQVNKFITLKLQNGRSNIDVPLEEDQTND